MKKLLLLTLITLPFQCLASDEVEAEPGARGIDKSLRYICTHQDEMSIINTVYQLHFDADVAMMLLSGDQDDAISALKQELIIIAQQLAAMRKGRVCEHQKDDTGLERARVQLYRSLRRLAAVNQVTPIPNLTDGNDVHQLFEQAIADDPAHYQKMLEQAQKQVEHYRSRVQQPAKSDTP